MEQHTSKYTLILRICWVTFIQHSDFHKSGFTLITKLQKKTLIKEADQENSNHEEIFPFRY